MTRNELVAAYQTGRIDRRTFIKGMTALGLSMSVASAMADRLRAAPATTSSRLSVRFAGDDTYGEPPDDTYEEPVDETGGVTTLPSTGAGDGPGRNWAAPLAALGGAAALMASRVRRLRSGESE